MATHSVIGLLNHKTNKVKFIECDISSTIEHNGLILKQSYSDDLAKVEKLISLGEILSLGAHTSAPKVVRKYGLHYAHNPNFENLSPRQKNQITDDLYTHTIAFHRDGKQKRILNFEEDFEKYCTRDGYVYLAIPNSGAGVTWYAKAFRDNYQSNTSFDGFEKLDVFIMEFQLIIAQMRILKLHGYSLADAENFFIAHNYALPDFEIRTWVNIGE